MPRAGDSDASDIPPPLYAPATSITDQFMAPPLAPATSERSEYGARGADRSSWRRWLSTDVLLRGAVIVTAGYFFVRLFVG